MRKSEQAKLRSIYDQIEKFKSQLEDLADEAQGHPGRHLRYSCKSNILLLQTSPTFLALLLSF